MRQPNTPSDTRLQVVMREGYDDYENDAACTTGNAFTKRTKVSGNKKRLITSTSNAAVGATRTNTGSRVRQTQEALPTRNVLRPSNANAYPTRYIPTYPKVHRDHLDLATLQYYDLPWEYSKAWIVI
ncbi:hypothetical protein CB0940_02980 [Cercospora beticola]|uniref:Uncharacterized protein n=2 Tax=Cercospora beticola TaxID=122368 RepID=A0A2G5I1Y8_CERBT|nr:hypothetical protein CB0940_02980 [Cercospora beticola]PIA98789.1 hypothetical protein CB0940_02980 [Cercospora beticola]